MEIEFEGKKIDVKLIRTENIITLAHRLHLIEEWLDTDAKFTRSDAKCRRVKEALVSIKMEIIKDVITLNKEKANEKNKEANQKNDSN